MLPVTAFRSSTLSRMMELTPAFSVNTIACRALASIQLPNSEPPV
jgi:hypothetical protein